MKRKLCCLLAVCLIIMATSASSIEVVGVHIDKEPYVYPLQPGDDLWGEIETKAEKLKLLQIPEDKLKSMTTQALLETVLNYPYLLDYQAFDTMESACNSLSLDFNGFRELLGRSDLTSVLLTQYNNTVVLTGIYDLEVDAADTMEFARSFYSSSTIEFLIVCDQLRNGEYSATQTEELYRIFGEKIQEREASGLYSAASEVHAKYLLEGM